MLLLICVALMLLHVAVGRRLLREAQAPPSLPFLHVVTPAAGVADATPYLADPSGRQVLLHGAAVVGMQDVAYPDANGGPAIFPVTPECLRWQVPGGLSAASRSLRCAKCRRICPPYDQSTSPGQRQRLRPAPVARLQRDTPRAQLEPARAPAWCLQRHLSRSGWNRRSGWARQQGIYVILDMHQDQYSRYILPGKPSTLPAGCTSSGGGDGAPAWAVFTDGKPACAYSA